MPGICINSKIIHIQKLYTNLIDKNIIFSRKSAFFKKLKFNDPNVSKEQIWFLLFNTFFNSQTEFSRKLICKFLTCFSVL